MDISSFSNLFLFFSVCNDVSQICNAGMADVLSAAFAFDKDLVRKLEIDFSDY